MSWVSCERRAAAQTCCAMLGAPGGLFLDVKSAYSSAADLQLFVAALSGIGIHVKVCVPDIDSQVLDTLYCTQCMLGRETAKRD